MDVDLCILIVKRLNNHLKIRLETHHAGTSLPLGGAADRIPVWGGNVSHGISHLSSD